MKRYFLVALFVLALAFLSVLPVAAQQTPPPPDAMFQTVMPGYTPSGTPVTVLDLLERVALNNGFSLRVDPEIRIRLYVTFNQMIRAGGTLQNYVEVILSQATGIQWRYEGKTLVIERFAPTQPLPPVATAPPPQTVRTEFFDQQRVSSFFINDSVLYVLADLQAKHNFSLTFGPGVDALLRKTPYNGQLEGSLRQVVNRVLANVPGIRHDFLGAALQISSERLAGAQAPAVPPVTQAPALPTPQTPIVPAAPPKGPALDPIPAPPEPPTPAPPTPPPATDDTISLSMSRMPLTELVELIAKEGGLSVVYIGEPTGDIGPIEVRNRPWQEILRSELDQAGFDLDYNPRTKTIRISKRQQQQLAAAAPPAAPQQPPDAEPPPTRQGAQMATEKITPIPGDLQSWLAWANQATGEEQEAFRLRNMRSDYDPCLYGDPGCRQYRPSSLPMGGQGRGSGPYSGSSYGNLRDEYYNYDSLFEHRLIQRAFDRDAWGALKFKKGPEGFVANVEIYGCNQRLAQADEANNLWDHKVLVPVNCRPLIFRYSDGKQDWEVEIDELIVPLRLQSAKNITLDRAFFTRARKRTSYLLYDLMEQADGSFKRVPRN